MRPRKITSYVSFFFLGVLTFLAVFGTVLVTSKNRDFSTKNARAAAAPPPVDNGTPSCTSSGLKPSENLGKPCCSGLCANAFTKICQSCGNNSTIPAPPGGTVGAPGAGVNYATPQPKFNYNSAPPSCGAGAYCYFLPCSASGRGPASGSCGDGAFCCTGSKIIPVCSVVGDVCGARYGTSCCPGTQCDTDNFVCVAGGDTPVALGSGPITNPGAGCFRVGDCATNNTMCHDVNGFLMPDGGACAPGATPGAALQNNNEANACTSGGGVCLSASRCEIFGLHDVNGGAGCGTAGNARCCGGTGVGGNASANDQTARDCFAGCIGLGLSETSCNATCRTGLISPANCLGDGTGVSTGMRASCCNGTHQRASGEYICGVGANLCVGDDHIFTTGATCCSGHTYTHNGANYCGVNPPGGISTVEPGQTCQRAPYTPQEGIGKCDCDNGQIINWGDQCFVNFGSSAGSAGRVRACQNNSTPGCWELLVCDGTSCQWVQTSGVIPTDSNIDIVYTSANENGRQVTYVDQNGQQHTVNIDSLSIQQFRDLVKQGKIVNFNQLYSAANNTGGLNLPQLDTLNQDAIRNRILNDPTLTQTEKNLLLQALANGQNPYAYQQTQAGINAGLQGATDWANRQEALQQGCLSGSIGSSTCAALGFYQFVDLVTLGGASATTQAAVNWAACNAEASAGLRPQGCGTETVVAAIAGVGFGQPFADAFYNGIYLPIIRPLLVNTFHLGQDALAALDAAIAGGQEFVPGGGGGGPNYLAEIPVYDAQGNLITFKIGVYDGNGNFVELSPTPAGGGAYAEVYLDHTDNVAIKVFKPTTLNNDLSLANAQNEIEFYQQYGGQAGIPEFKGYVYDAQGNVVGYKQTLVPGQTLTDFYASGGRLTQEQIDQAAQDLQNIQNTTHRAHGDIAGSGKIQNPDNIIITPDGKVQFIDFSGFDPNSLADPSVMAGEQSSLVQGLQDYAK